MKNGSHVSEMLHDEINIMFTDWPMTKDMVIKGTPPPLFFNCIIIVFLSISMYILYYKLIYFNISKLTLYVFITEMAEYTRIQQKEEEEQDMDIQNIFEQELKLLEEDQDINEFITELFNENNTLPKCELDQWLEDYLEEMEIQQKKKENKVKKYQMKTIFLLFWICVITLIYHQLKMKILLHQVSVKKIRMKKNKIIIMEIIFTILAIVYFAVEASFMESSKEEILVQNL